MVHPLFDIILNAVNFIDSPLMDINLSDETIIWLGTGVFLLGLLSESSRKDR